MKKLTFDEGTLYQGDCLEVLKRLPSDSVDLVFGSPPYEDRRTYGIDFKLEGEEWVEWLYVRMVEMLRVCKGVVAMVVEGKTRNYQYSGTPILLQARLMQEYCLRKPAVFQRVGIPGSGGPDWLRNDWEFIVCVTRERGKLTWSDQYACARPWKYKPGGQLSYRNTEGKRLYKRAAPQPGQGDVVTKHPIRAYKTETANPGNVIDCGSAGGSHLGSNIAHENEAPFPEKLVGFFVRSFCPPDGIVLDPFMGSGTTAAVAIKAARRFIGMDVRQSQIDLTTRRIKQARQRKGFGV